MKKKIVNSNGIVGELCMTMEECGELIQACNKYLRATGHGQKTRHTEEESVKSLIEEISHVQNCIYSLQYLLKIGDETIQAEIKKSDRECFKVFKEKK